LEDVTKILWLKEDRGMLVLLAVFQNQKFLAVAGFLTFCRGRLLRSSWFSFSCLLSDTLPTANGMPKALDIDSSVDMGSTPRMDALKQGDCYPNR
jgi:hypothetical protein